VVIRLLLERLRLVGGFVSLVVSFGSSLILGSLAFVFGFALVICIDSTDALLLLLERLGIFWQRSE
jgi:hypothetical protein